MSHCQATILSARIQSIAQSNFNRSLPHDLLLQHMQTLHSFDGSQGTSVQSYISSLAHFGNQSCLTHVCIPDDCGAPVFGRESMICTTCRWTAGPGWIRARQPMLQSLRGHQDGESHGAVTSYLVPWVLQLSRKDPWWAMLCYQWSAILLATILRWC